MSNIYNFFKTAWYLDYRSLALSRICFALIIIADLLCRLYYVFAHYSDWGTLARSKAILNAKAIDSFSLHFISGNGYFQILLFIVALIFALMMLVGYKTRLSTVVSFFLLISLQNRNILVLQGGDVVFRVSVFWLMFMPLAEYYSVDKYFKPLKIKKTKYEFSIFSFAFITQIVILYLFTGLLKTGIAWHDTGTAVFSVMNVAMFQKPYAAFIATLPKPVLSYLTKSVVTWYVVASFLLIQPFFSKYLRFFAVLGLIFMQINFGMALALGLFPLICIAGLLALLPDYFWDSILPYLYKKLPFKNKNKLTLYYDKDCGICEKSVNTIKMYLFLNKLNIKTVQSDSIINDLSQKNNSWVLSVLDITGNKTNFLKWDVVSRLVKNSFLFPFYYILNFKLVKYLGEKLYGYISSNRYVVCSIPSKNTVNNNIILDKVAYIIRPVLYVFVACMLYFVVVWNVNGLPVKSCNNVTSFINRNILMQRFVRNPVDIIPLSTDKSLCKNIKLTKTLDKLPKFFRLDQSWNMFSPDPISHSNWIVNEATLENGKVFDLYNGKDTVSFEKPKWAYKQYSIQRWRKYMMNLGMEAHKSYRDSYSKWVCKSYNEGTKVGERLKSFKLWYMEEKINPKGNDIQRWRSNDSEQVKTFGEVKNIKVIDWSCI